MTTDTTEDLASRLAFYREQYEVERKLRHALMEEIELLQAEVRALSEGIMDTLIDVTD